MGGSAEALVGLKPCFRAMQGQRRLLVQRAGAAKGTVCAFSVGFNEWVLKHHISEQGWERTKAKDANGWEHRRQAHKPQGLRALAGAAQSHTRSRRCAKSWGECRPRSACSCTLADARFPRNSVPIETYESKGLGAGPGEGGIVLSDDEDPEREARQAARWATKWRLLEREALVIAEAMRNPEAQRHMLFIAEAYRVLAERARERSERSAALARAKHTPDEDRADE